MISTRWNAPRSRPMPSTPSMSTMSGFEPPGVVTAFWRGVGPVHNVFVVESFIDELAAAARRDPVDYRKALLGHNPRALAVLTLAAEKAGWGSPLPKGQGRGISVQFAFGSYLSQVAEVEVAADGSVRVRRIVCAVDCGLVVNPDTVEAQVQGGTLFGLTAALHGAITFKDGRVEQANFRYLPADADRRGAGDGGASGAQRRGAGRAGRGGDRHRLPGGDQRDLRRHRQAHPAVAHRHGPAQDRLTHKAAMLRTAARARAAPACETR